MDTPPLQFAQAPDGTTIAYWVMGSGPPLVLNYGGFYASVADHWDLPEFRAFYQALADEWSLVCYDWRGYGNSSGEQGLENGADLDAVRGDAGLETLTLVGVSPGADVMPRYALEHPDHVARVVTWNATRHGAPLPFRTLFGLREDYPRLFHETWLLWRGWHEKSSRDQVIAMALAERGFSASTRFGRGLQDEALEKLRVPVDVVFSRDSELNYAEPARFLASRIPGGRLIGMPRRELDPHLGDIEPILDYFRSIHPGEVSALASAQAFRTILFTDIVASTPLLAQLGDAKFREVMRDHDAVLSALIQEHGGRVIKTIGDAFMVEFALPSAAVACAIAMQRGIQAQFADSEVPIRLRIGINAGEPIVDDGDPHGISVNIAKRLESAAPVNGILVSDVVKQAVVGKDFEFRDAGEVALKGFEEPVRAWSVSWTG